VKVGIGAVDLYGFVPDHRLQPKLWLPMKLDEGRFPLSIDQAKSMNPKAFHKAEGSRDRSIRHDPHRHVDTFGCHRDEVPEVIVRGLRLRKSSIRLLLRRVDDIRKLDGVLNKEHGDVVANDVPIAFLCVEFYREATDVAREVGRALVAGYGRETHKRGCFLPCSLEEIGFRHLRQRLVVLEIAMGPETAGVDDTLGNALMIKMKDFLAKVKVFERSGTARADLEGILVIGYRDALLRGQHGRIAGSGLVGFSASAARYYLIGVPRVFVVVHNAPRLVRGLIFLWHRVLLSLYEVVKVGGTRRICATSMPWRVRATLMSQLSRCRRDSHSRPKQV
jgi:hypothetical protein